MVRVIWDSYSLCSGRFLPLSRGSLVAGSNNPVLRGQGLFTDSLVLAGRFFCCGKVTIYCDAHDCQLNSCMVTG